MNSGILNHVDKTCITLPGSINTTETRTDTPKLSCRNVWKIYGAEATKYFHERNDQMDSNTIISNVREIGGVPAAVDVSFDVRVGEIFVIMGLSGSGKSTMIRCLSRLVEPTHGKVLLDGEDLLTKSSAELINIRRHKMGMVFQNFGLLPHLTVVENIMLPLKLQQQPISKQRDSAERVIQLVGLEGRQNSYPHQLSGGQQQRVGIARSLAVEPEFWFLDEPFSALDPLIRRQMQDEFLRLQRVLKKSIVFITHDFLEALRIADRMMIMRDGQVVQVGTPEELVTSPVDDYVGQFTADVPLARVLTAKDIAQQCTIEEVGLIRVHANCSVEKLLPKLVNSEQGLIVEEANGRILGKITAQGVIRALSHNAS